jgi:hypothetical protein
MSNYGLSDEAKREIEKLDETQAHFSTAKWKAGTCTVHVALVHNF